RFVGSDRRLEAQMPQHGIQDRLGHEGGARVVEMNHVRASGRLGPGARHVDHGRSRLGVGAHKGYERPACRVRKFVSGNVSTETCPSAKSSPKRWYATPPERIVLRPIPYPRDAPRPSPVFTALEKSPLGRLMPPWTLR